MNRLTKKTENGTVTSDSFTEDLLNKLADYEDAEERGELLRKERAVNEGYLQDWYIASVSEKDKPVWTEEHISELCNDFIIIPKEETEQTFAEMKGV